MCFTPKSHNTLTAKLSYDNSSQFTVSPHTARRVCFSSDVPTRSLIITVMSGIMIYYANCVSANSQLRAGRCCYCLNAVALCTFVLMKYHFIQLVDNLIVQRLKVSR